MTTMKKKMEIAQRMPKLRGVETDYFYIRDALIRTSPTFRDESVARQRASEVEKASAYVGVYMSAEEIKIQEKWERILISLEGMEITA